MLKLADKTIKNSYSDYVPGGIETIKMTPFKCVELKLQYLKCKTHVNEIIGNVSLSKKD